MSNVRTFINNYIDNNAVEIARRAIIERLNTYFYITDERIVSIIKSQVWSDISSQIRNSQALRDGMLKFVNDNGYNDDYSDESGVIPVIEHSVDYELFEDDPIFDISKDLITEDSIHAVLVDYINDSEVRFMPEYEPSSFTNYLLSKSVTELNKAIEENGLFNLFDDYRESQQ